MLYSQIISNVRPRIIPPEIRIVPLKRLVLGLRREALALLERRAGRGHVVVRRVVGHVD